MTRNILSALAAGALMALTACATPPEAIKAVADAQARAAERPTITLECAQGCKATYTDPRDRAQGIKAPTNGWDALATVTGSVERVVTGAVLPAATVAIAREIRRAGEGGNTTTTTTTTASGAGASTGGPGNYEQVGPDSGNTTTTTTTSTTDNSNRSTTTTNTATPTIVTQPAPIVVTQPAPVVVAP